MGSPDLKKIFYGLFVILTALYVVINFATEPNPLVLERFRVDAFQFRLLSLAIVLPLIAVWFAAFYGLIHLVEYARRIKDSEDGVGFRWLTAGMITIGVGLPLNSLITTLVSRGAAMDLISQATSTIISTHTAILFPLIGFFLVAVGSRKLMKSAKKPEDSTLRFAIVAAGLAILSVLYTYTALQNPAREVAIPPALTATYYMNDLLIVTTIIIPYVLVWMFGFYAVIWLRAYERSVGGILYKKALKKLNRGLLLVILASIIIQLLTAAVTSIYAWQLGAIVLLLYLLVAVVGGGYLIIALGAKGLAKLEEVK